LQLVGIWRMEGFFRGPMLKLLPIVVSVATFAVGWFLGTPSHRDAGREGEAGRKQASGAGSRADGQQELNANGNDRVLGTLRRAEEQTKNLVSGSHQKAVLLEELEKFSPEEVGQMARAALGEKHRLSELLMGYWSEVDLPGVGKWLATLKHDEILERVRTFHPTWARTEGGALLGMLETLPSEARHTVLNSVGRILPIEKDPERVLSLLETLPFKSNFANGYDSVFREWGKKDPAAAAARAVGVKNIEARTKAVGEVARQWGAKDPAAAWKWVESLGDASLVSQATLTYVDGMSWKNPRAAAEFAAELPLTAANQRVMENVIGTWAQQNPAEALAWAETMEEDAARGRLLHRIVQTVSHRDVEQAAKLCAKYAAQLPEDSDVLETVGWRILQTKGADGAEAFTATLPADVSGKVWECLVTKWADADMQALVKWSEGLPEGPRRAKAFHSFAVNQAARDIRAANAWAKSLAVTESHKPAIERVARDVFFRNPDKGVELAARVATGKELERVVESWMFRIVGQGTPDLGEWYEKTEALSAEAKGRIRRAFEERQKR
jgi:hypothetical protein